MGRILIECGRKVGNHLERGHNEPKVRALETEPGIPNRGRGALAPGKRPERGHNEPKVRALETEPGTPNRGRGALAPGKRLERGQLALETEPGSPNRGRGALAPGKRPDLTARRTRRIGRVMESRHPWLASVLAVAVTVGGAVCACAAGPLDAAHAATEAPHHAAHHAPAEAASCERADCTGACEFTGASPERDPLPVKPPNAADDFEGVPPPFAMAASVQVRGLSPPAATSRLWARPDTPVHRFDILLN